MYRCATSGLVHICDSTCNQRLYHDVSIRGLGRAWGACSCCPTRHVMTPERPNLVSLTAEILDYLPHQPQAPPAVHNGGNHGHGDAAVSRNGGRRAGSIGGHSGAQ